LVSRAEILQRLHDSEINVELRCFYDWGWRWRLGDAVTEGVATTAAEAIVGLAEAAFAEFPHSRFAAWWREQRSAFQKVPEPSQFAASTA
jgi:hypothetical protein